MGFLVKVIRNNYDGVIRHANKLISQDPRSRMFMKRRYNEKPCQYRRRIRSDSTRRLEKAQLLDNLRVVFARKARGF